MASIVFKDTHCALEIPIRQVRGRSEAGCLQSLHIVDCGKK